MNIFLQAAAAVFTPSALFFMLVGTFSESSAAQCRAFPL